MVRYDASRSDEKVGRLDKDALEKKNLPEAAAIRKIFFAAVECNPATLEKHLFQLQWKKASKKFEFAMIKLCIAKG